MTETIEVISLAIGIFSGIVLYFLARRHQSELWKRTIPVTLIVPRTDVSTRAPTCGFDHSTATAHACNSENQTQATAEGKGMR